MAFILLQFSLQQLWSYSSNVAISKHDNKPMWLCQPRIWSWLNQTNVACWTRAWSIVWYNKVKISAWIESRINISRVRLSFFGNPNKSCLFWWCICTKYKYFNKLLSKHFCGCSGEYPLDFRNLNEMLITQESNNGWYHEIKDRLLP